MDEFVERIVANVRGTVTAPDGAIARPHYQREKARGRLVISDVVPKPEVVAVRASRYAGADSLPSLRRVALAAAVPSPVPAETACRKSACAGKPGCWAETAAVSVHTVDEPPRALSEMLGIRWRADDAVAAASVERSRLLHLIAADDILVRTAIPPEAMAFSVGPDRTLLLRFAGETAKVAAALGEIRSAWEARPSSCRVALSPMPSPKLLAHLGVGRRSAVGVLDDVDPARAVAVVGDYVKAGGKAELRLLDGAVLLIGSAEQVREGAEQMKTMFLAMSR